jgi:hypothetical protein
MQPIGGQFNWVYLRSSGIADLQVFRPEWKDTQL